MVERTPTDRGVILETELLNSIIWDSDTAIRYSLIHRDGLLISAFGDWLVEKCISHRKAHHEAIGEGIISVARTEAAIEGSGITNSGLAVIERWVTVPTVTKNVHYLMEQAEIHLKLRAAERYAERCIEAVKAFDADRLEMAQTEYVSATADRSSSMVNFTSSGLRDRMFDSNRSEDLFGFGGYFGRMMKGRLGRDNLVAFAAQPKTGKTATLCRMAAEAMRSGNNVLFISVGDDDTPEIAARITSYESGTNMEETGGRVLLPYFICADSISGACDGYEDELMIPTPTKQVLEETPPEELVKMHPDFTGCTACRNRPGYKPAIWWKWVDIPTLTEEIANQTHSEISTCAEYGELKLDYYSARQLTVSMIDAKLEYLKAGNWVPDVLVIDYADMLGIETRASQRWEGLQKVWEDLRGLANKWDNLIITATQGNREGAGVETQTRQTVAGTVASVDNCKMVIGINQTPAEKAAGVLRYNFIAHRKGASLGPEHQALCCAWLCVQDPFRDSVHIYKRIEKTNGRK